MNNIILTFIITIIFGYIFGLIIVTLIDNRLNKLNKLNIESYINSDDLDSESQTDEGVELDDNSLNSSNNFKTVSSSSNISNTSSKKNKTKKVIRNNENMQKFVQTNTMDFKTGKLENDKFNYNFDKDYYDSMYSYKVEGFADLPAYKGWTFERKEMLVCYKNHLHVKDGKSTMCTYGVTNYADPKDMSPVDLKMFMLNYPSNMTLQDYINWLYAYVGKEDELPYNHLKNLEKLKMGIELVYEEGVLPPPAYNYPPMRAEDYFDKMYNSKNEFNIAGPLNSQTGPMVGYNYNEYSEFSQNMDVYGTSGEIRNPDIAIKKNARQLRDFVEPKDSYFIKETDENNIYRIKKNEV